MKDEHHDRNVEALFHEARQQSNAEQRAAYLEKACGDDTALRARIEKLLAAEAELGSFLRSTDETLVAPRGVRSSSGVPTIASPLSEKPGTVIGRYKLLQQIGEGGFGVVYMAEQEQPVRRKVALKIIKLGMDTLQIIARFEAERQALAMMDHPHIAKVLDAGATETGRPYFVMELVKGMPITEYCDKQNMSFRGRLQLFTQVCGAVQHAHQKGVIHRDIKPSNVLVTHVDDKPVPKVIDFGIAKATQQRLTEETMFTEFGQFMGTPEYMSPEQADPLGLDIDTRSDIYSLGVLLYELLTGATPFDMRTLRKAGVDEIKRMIREQEPPRPSTRLSKLGPELDTVARQRAIEPKKLGTILRGDLDWIIMKALEKDRTRRYETANGLGLDIQRYLSGEAVVAAPPSTSYRLRKFVRRNKGSVIAGALVAVALLMGIAGTTWGMFWALNEKDRADAAVHAERAAKAEALENAEMATQEASRAKALNNFMQQMIRSANPEMSGDREITVMEMLLKASEKADQTLKDEPIAEAEARTYLATTLRIMGRFNDAAKEARRAIELRESGIERGTLHHAESIRALAVIQMSLAEYQQAVANFQQALSILKALQPFPLKELCTAHIDLARALTKLGQFAEAEKALDQGEETASQLNPPDLHTRASFLGIRALLMASWRGDHEKAEELQTQDLELRRQLADQPLLADTLNSLAITKMHRGATAEALVLYQECLDIQRKEYGDVHQTVAITLENMANAYFSRKEYDQAITRLDEVMAVRTKLFGADSFQVARTRFNMGVLTSTSGDHLRGLELIDSALVVFRKHLGENHIEVGQALRNRAISLKRMERYDESLRAMRAALQIFDGALPPTDRVRIRTVADIAELLCLRGSFDDGEKTANDALKLLDPANPAHESTIKFVKEKLNQCRTASPQSPQPPGGQ